MNEDYQIVQRVLSGDKKAYGQLVDRHQQRAMVLALRILRNREDAEEALQDAFVRAFHALSRFEWKSSFSTWFYRIVYNVCISAASRKREHSDRSLGDMEESAETFELPSTDPTPDVELEQAEIAAILEDEIARLPDAYGPTFTLFFVQELSYEEIVAVTGFPLGTVKARIFRARALLRNAVIRRLGKEVLKDVLVKEKSI